MKDRSYNIGYAEHILLEACRPLDKEKIALSYAAGRVLACDLTDEDARAKADDFFGMEKENVVLKKGSLIKPILHGTLVAMGIPEVEVYRKPLIGIFILGDSQGEDVQCEYSVELNRHILGNALKEMDFSYILQGAISSDGVQLFPNFRMAAHAYDAIIICGGSGENDFANIQRLLAGTGAEMLVDSLLIHPGNSFCAALHNQIPVFGIAGKPMDILTDLYLSVVPVLKKISGRSDDEHERITVELDGIFEEENEVERILLGKLDLTQGTVNLPWSKDPQNMELWKLQEVDVAAVVPAGAGPLKKGTLLTAYKLIR